MEPGRAQKAGAALQDLVIARGYNARGDEKISRRAPQIVCERRQAGAMAGSHWFFTWAAHRETRMTARPTPVRCVEALLLGTERTDAVSEGTYRTCSQYVSPIDKHNMRVREICRTVIVIVSIAVLAVGAPSAYAQTAPGDDESAPSERREGGAGFFAIGTNVVGISALNDRLESFGYPTFGSAFLSLGGGGYGLVGGRFLLGGEGHGVIRPAQSVQGRRVSVGGGYGLATLGYLAWARGPMRVFPQVGLGGGGFTVDIGSTGEATEFDDVLGDPNRRAELSRGSLLVSLAVTATYQAFSAPEEAGGVRIGLQAGYLFAPLSSEWQLDDHPLSDGPDAGFGGPFVRLLIGGGGSD